jgi:hypothetical protein
MKKVIGLCLTIFILGLVACSTSNTDFELYEGKPLNIAVIGELPEVKEEQISFQEIKFEDLLDGNLNTYDAVFVTKENLSEASESQYADVYFNSKIPFIFIEAKKSYHPFIEKDLTYEESLDLKEVSNHYAIGYLSSETEEDRYWYYGLYNDEVSEENIKATYSIIFGTIASSN